MTITQLTCGDVMHVLWSGLVLTKLLLQIVGFLISLKLQQNLVNFVKTVKKLVNFINYFDI
jgi:hypothetical protein